MENGDTATEVKTEDAHLVALRMMSRTRDHHTDPRALTGLSLDAYIILKLYIIGVHNYI